MSKSAEIAAILREHRRTTGMAPAMGDTCHCGEWCRGETDWKSEPRTCSDLAQHQAEKIVEGLELGDE